MPTSNLNTCTINTCAKLCVIKNFSPNSSRIESWDHGKIRETLFWASINFPIFLRCPQVNKVNREVLFFSNTVLREILQLYTRKERHYIPYPLFPILFSFIFSSFPPLTAVNTECILCSAQQHLQLKPTSEPCVFNLIVFTLTQ